MIVLHRAESALPVVERTTVVTDTVTRGEMVRSVRGPGALVSERVRWIAALTAGRVERIRLRPGDRVTEESIVLELSNPDVEIEALEAEQQLADQESRLVDLRTGLESERLSQEAIVAALRAPHREAHQLLDTNERLSTEGLIAAQAMELARARALEFDTRLDIETRRLEVMTSAGTQQLDAQRAQVERLQAIADFKRRRVASMIVRAGATGVLAELPLDEGQWVRPGDSLARVVDPVLLAAELRLPEASARDVELGQRATISTRTGTTTGRVARVDPTASGGTVTVRIDLDPPVPKGARPDLGVDGIIEIEKIEETLHVRRPAYGEPRSSVSMFRVDADGTACRAHVRLGRASVNTVEILDGLSPGDEVIVSDMSRWSAHDRVRLR